MRLLIYGAGVIGSIYAMKFKSAGFDVTILARGKRLQSLRENGLQYKEDGRIKTMPISVIESLEADDSYDFIFLPVQTKQVEFALKQMCDNCSPNIVTMVNTIKDVQEWEHLCGKGRLIPAFPGAGGGIVDGVLEGALTPGVIQPTTFGEIHGEKTDRVKVLAKLFKKSKIPYQIVSNMHNWQVSHLGMVVPLADAYYRTKTPMCVYQDQRIMRDTAVQMKKNFNGLAYRHMLTPFKLHVIRKLPIPILTRILRFVYRSHFGDVFMYQHAMKAKDEMKELHDAFYAYMNL